MPVYQVEKYVEKAIRSILNQTFRDFEFLIVDDGTKDNSGAICDLLATEDDRITVIHKHNEGAPVARNTAMNMAQGKYYYFMDSDDWVEPTMLEDMVRIAEENASELVISGFYIDTYYNDSEYLTTDYVHESYVYRSQSEFRRKAYRLFDKNLLYSPWNKLWLRTYVDDHNIRFPKTFWDDFPFILEVIRDVERVAVTDQQYYHFIRARAESETAKYRPEMYDKREEEHQWMIDLYKHWNVSNHASMEMIHRRYIERLIGCLENVTNPNSSLTMIEQKKLMSDMLSKPHVKESLSIMRPKSMMMKIMLIPIRLHSIGLTYLMCKYISTVKIKNVERFARLKASR